MGTHNRLLGLGEDLYLELIAIDPQASRHRAGRAGSGSIASICLSSGRA
jgi:hypothetical protein